MSKPHYRLERTEPQSSCIGCALHSGDLTKPHDGCYDSFPCIQNIFTTDTKWYHLKEVKDRHANPSGPV